MSRSRPPYPPELRRKRVELVRAGRSPRELAEQYEPTEQSIRNWVEQADRDEGQRSDGLTSAEKEEPDLACCFGWALRSTQDPGRRAGRGVCPALGRGHHVCADVV
jgi:transposase